MNKYYFKVLKITYESSWIEAESKEQALDLAENAEDWDFIDKTFEIVEDNNENH